MPVAEQLIDTYLGEADKKGNLTKIAKKFKGISMGDQRGNRLQFEFPNSKAAEQFKAAAGKLVDLVRLTRDERGNKVIADLRW